MSHDMALQMVDIDERNTQCTCKSLGKTNPHKQRPHKTRPSCKCNSRKLLLGDASPLYSLVNHWNNILLMSTRCQFWHNTTVCLMDVLTCSYIAQQHPITQYSSRSVIATTLNT